MSYEPIRARAANRPFYLNNDNELAVAPYTGSALAADFKFVLSKSPVLEGSVTLASGATLTLDSGYNPTNDYHVATKAYVDSIATGLDLKKSVKAATTGNITLANEQTIDGVALVAGDRVLVKDQTDATENGIYVVVDGGSWTRSTDADNTPAGEVSAGMFTFVEQGTAYADTGWILTTDAEPIVLGTTELEFSQFSSATAMMLANVGTGSQVFKNQVGNTFNLRTLLGTSNRLSVSEGTNEITFDIDAAYVGQTSITTLGTITTGTWSASTIAVNKGGTGLTSYTAGDLLYASGSTTLAKLAIGSSNQVLTVSGGLPAWSSSLSLTDVTVSGNFINSGWTGSRLLSSNGSKQISENAALSSNGFIYATGSGALASTAAAADGELLIGRTGLAPVKATLTGTANQVIITNGAGSITLSTPQDIGTGSTPTFDNVIIGGTPSAANHAITKGYVDSLAQGLDVKQSVRAATTANIDLSSAPAAIDGVTLSSGDRVLVKDQTTGSENGIYIFNGSGSAMTRSADADSDADVTAGMFAFVTEGTVNADTGWILVTDDAVVLDTTSLTFTQFSSVNATTLVNVGGFAGVFRDQSPAGTFNLRSLQGTTNRLTVTQNSNDIAFDISASYVGQASITTLGTITTGTWSATTIAANKGGTGFSSYTVGDLLYADTTSTLAKRAIGTAGQVLHVSGGLPAWTSSLSVTDVTVSGNFTNSSYNGTRLLVSNGSKQIVEHAALTANAVVYASAANAFTSVSLTNGQLLIGSTGAAPVAAAITGTANQILVTNGAGSITLSAPQDIHSGATPTFAGLTLTGLLTGTSTAMAISTKTANYSVDANDFTILVDTTSGNITITLPDASANSGRIINVKKIVDVAGDVIVDTAGGNIDGSSSFTIYGFNEAVTFQSNGTDWFIL